jgi:single-stranded DNA-binding protein
MQTRSWEKDGQKQYRTEIIMDRFEFGPSTGGGGASAGSAAPSTQKDSGVPVLPDYPEEEINPEDIPF